LGNNNVKDYPPYLDYPKPRKPITEADRIRSMTDEELAEFAAGTGQGCAPGKNLVECSFEHKDGPVEADCRKCWLDWLKEEAKE
jgi:hypothetical protein